VTEARPFLLLPGRVLGLVLGLALAACGGAVPPPRQPLYAQRAAELVSPPAAPAVELLHDDFAAGWADWTRVTDETSFDDAHPERLVLERGEEGGRPFVRLGGVAGSLYRSLPVEPDTDYEFTIALRDNGLAGAPGFTAGVVLGECAGGAGACSPRDIVPPGDPGFRLFLVQLGASGWQTWRQVFRTGSSAHALVAAVNLGIPRPATGGSLDVTGVVLRRVPAATLWDERARLAAAECQAGDAEPSPWQARRRVRAELDHEWRPSIALLPGERIGFEIVLPEGAPRFECGLGPWSAGYARSTGGTPGELALEVRVDGAPLQTLTAALAGTLARERWRDFEVDLARWAGTTVRLELTLTGPCAAVVGAPLVHDAAARSEAKNLVLISIDTLRADHVGAYGYDGDTTPTLDALAREGVLFESVVAQAPYTLPSHATLFSGQFPSVHGVQSGHEVLSSQRSPLLARALEARGYASLAVTAGGFVVPRWGFDKGFERFVVNDALRHDNRADYAEKLAGAAAGDGPSPGEEPGVTWLARWLAEQREQPFFLFLHTYEVHDYSPPPEFSRCAQRGCTEKRVDPDRFRIHPRTGWTPVQPTPGEHAHILHGYDDALHHIDHEIGLLLRELERLGLAERTIVAVTSDHGEEMFERGFLQHGKSVYEETTRIPMIVRIPGEAPRRIATPAMQADLAPVLYAALGLAPDARMQGIDLLDVDPGERATWTEIHDNFVHQYALRSGGWKLLHGPPDEGVQFPSPVEWELYDLTTDPLERTNLAKLEPVRLDHLRDTLLRTQSALESLGKSLGSVAGAAELDEATRKDLEGLGYTGR